MSRDAYVDESQRQGRYVLAAVAVEAGRVTAVRRQLLLQAPRGGAVRRHFVKESEASRRKLLSAFRSLEGIELLVYEARDARRPTEQRARCLDLLTTELLGSGLSRMVLDHVEDAQRRRDRQTLGRRLDGTLVSYGHEPAHSREPMLWIPDAVAWCAGRAEWRRELDGWVLIRRV